MYKHQDHTRTEVRVRYITNETIDSIVERVRDTKGLLQNENVYYAEEITLREIRTVRLKAYAPKAEV